MRMKARVVVPVALLIGSLAGCATMPTEPSILALPGTGKSLNDFRASDFQCRHYAAQQIGASTGDPALRNAAIGTAIGAVAGAAIGGHQGAGVGAGAGLLFGSATGAEASRSYGYDAQRRYDNAYVQCMYAGGHKVPVSAAMARGMVESSSSAPAATGTSIPPPPPHAPPASPPPDYVAPAPAK